LEVFYEGDERPMNTANQTEWAKLKYVI